MKKDIVYIWDNEEKCWLYILNSKYCIMTNESIWMFKIVLADFLLYQFLFPAEHTSVLNCGHKPLYSLWVAAAWRELCSSLFISESSHT